MASNKQDRIGEWFLTTQAQRLGLVFTVMFGCTWHHFTEKTGPCK